MRSQKWNASIFFTSRRTYLLLSVLLLLFYSCKSPKTAQFIPKSILSFDDSSAYRYNRDYINKVDIPAIIELNFRTKDPSNPYHTFLADFAQYKENGIPYEWWPIIPGTADPKHPTVQEPSLFFSGTITNAEESTNDINFSHPFQLRDFSFDAYPFSSSSEYRNLIYNSADKDHKNVWRSLHIEIEKGLFPYQAFGWTPQPNDAVLAYGNWILDAGHNPFETEIHPPAFLAMARMEANKTISFAYAAPFRTTQLFNPDKSLANKIEDFSRFKNSNTKPFPQHLKDEISKVYTAKSNRLEAHSLIESVNPGVITWFVCDTTPHAALSELKCDYHFTTRTGVNITVIKQEGMGCFQFIASVGSNYNPAGTNRVDTEWKWDEIDKQAGVNVRSKIYEAAANPLHIPNPAIERNPKIDLYDQLLPIPGESIITQPQISVSDLQPFPFYGWANVYWKDKIVTTIGSRLPNCIAANFTEIQFYTTGEVKNNQLITISNTTNQAIQLGQLFIDGTNPDRFSLNSATLILTKPGGTQPSENCSNTILQPNSSCSFRVAIINGEKNDLPSAVIHVPVKDNTQCELRIPVKQLNNVQ